MKTIQIQFWPHDIQKVKKDIEFVMAHVKMSLELTQRLFRSVKILDKGKVVKEETKGRGCVHDSSIPPRRANAVHSK